MRNFIFIMLLALVALSASASQDSFEQSFAGESYGFGSDEAGGGSYLGVDTRNLTSDRMGALKLKEEKGIEITMVDQDAPAGKAGLKDHDVILSMNGTEVQSVEQFRRLIRETPPGRVVSLSLSRDGQPLTLKVQLADRKSAFSYSFPEGKSFKFAMPAMPAVPAVPAVPPDIDVPVSIVVVHSSVRSGLMIENLTPQLGEFFGTKNGQGVLVRSVEKGSRAEKAGFRAGDVITKVNGESVNDASDFSHLLRSRKANTASIGIIRDKKEQTLTLSLPERNQSSVFESLDDIPDIHAETDIDLSGLRSDLAEIGPQVQLAIEQAQDAMKQAGKVICDQTQKWQQQHKQQIEKQRLELRKQQAQMREQMRSQRHVLRDEVQRELRTLTMI
jgi:serine protease Do